MRERKYFPTIVTERTKKGYVAGFCLSLDSILHGALFLRQFFPIQAPQDLDKSLEGKALLERREALMRTLCSYPENITIELHFTAIPNLHHRPRGSLQVSLFLYVRSERKRDSMEQAAARYLSIMPLLASHMPEAEFVPVTSRREYQELRRPFAPSHALCVRRKREDVVLSEPFRRTSMGFLNDLRTEDVPGSSIDYCYPWRPSMNDWSVLLETMLGGLDPVKVVIRFSPSGDCGEARRWLSGIIVDCDKFLSSGSRDLNITRKQVEAIQGNVFVQLAGIASHSCRLGVFILALQPIDTAFASIIGQSITRDISSTNIFEGGFSVSGVPVGPAEDIEYFPEDEPFTPAEAACAFRLPSPPMQEQFGLPVKRSRTNLIRIPDDLMERSDALMLFENEFRGMIQPMWISADDRMRHMFIIGQTGTGKSTLMEAHILQDIRDGRGVAVIDPHGDLVDGILGKIPPSRAGDVIVFDVLDRLRPLGFNICQYSTPDERDLIIDDLYQTIDRIYDMNRTGGPIFEANFRGMLKLLLPEKPREGFTPTLLEFMMCYQDKKFRAWLMENNTDHQVKDFVKELEGATGDARIENISPYITSKFSRFIHDSTLKNIIGQERSSIDFSQIMDHGKIFLVKLGKGRFGSEVSALIANQLVSRFKIAAMKRGQRKASERRDFFLYVDEAHNLPAENLIQLLSEARKYRLGLVLATQYASQLASVQKGMNNDLLSALLGNAGTIILFRLGQLDADLMAPVFAPLFTAQDICGLPNWNGFARLQISRDSLQPFSFRSCMDTAPFNASAARNILEESRARYGRDADEVRAEIDMRRNKWREGDD